MTTQSARLILISVVLVLVYLIVRPHIAMAWHVSILKNGRHTMSPVTFFSETACWNVVGQTNKDSTDAVYRCQPFFTLTWGW